MDPTQEIRYFSNDNRFDRQFFDKTSHLEVAQRISERDPGDALMKLSILV